MMRHTISMMKHTKFYIILWAALLMSMTLHAQDFNQYFTDATLRLDYIFSGDVAHQEISVDQLNRIPHWWGKRSHLSEVPLAGNGQVIVRDHRTQTVIYRNSFSTLFQEWLTYDEAKTIRKSYENVFLVPMPKDTADITVELYNNRRELATAYSHMVVPTDILIRHIGEHDVTPYDIIQHAKNPQKSIQIAFVAEGYTESEMNVFLKDVHTATEALFNHEPFKRLQDRFEVVAVKSVSQESGTSIPSAGIWKNTVLHSHFDTFYSDRYLTTLHLKDLHDVLAGVPYEHIIVLVNTEHYGGGGIFNSYNLSMTHHPKYCPVVVHEFGHSFGGLADEYAYENEPIPAYPHDVEPWEPNITTQADFSSKWQDMVSDKGKEPVGLYEGAGYSLNGVYRPCQDCRMRTNENPHFCAVCDRALTRLIEFYTGE